MHEFLTFHDSEDHLSLDLKMTSGISWFLLRLFPVSTNCNNTWPVEIFRPLKRQRRKRKNNYFHEPSIVIICLLNHLSQKEKKRLLNLISNLIFQEEKNTDNYWNEQLRGMETDFFSRYIKSFYRKKRKKRN